MESAVDEGAIRSIGVSNFQPKYIEHLLDNCRIPPLMNQLELHPGYVERDTVECCAKQGIVVEAYSPLMQGDARLLKNNVVVEIARKKQRTPAQVVLRWCVEQGFVVLPKSETKSRIEENFAIFDFSLEEDEMHSISRLGDEINEKVCWDSGDVP